MAAERTGQPGRGQAQQSSGRGLSGFTRHTFIAVGVSALMFVALFLAWQVAEILLLAFAGLLLSIFFRSLAGIVARHTPLSEGWSLGVVLLVVAVVIGAGVWFLGARISSEVDQLSVLLPAALEDLRKSVSQYQWGRNILDQLPTASDLAPSGGWLARATGIFSTTLDLIINAGLVLFVGIYLAVEPGMYKRGLIKLVPISRRERAKQVLDTSGQVLQSWLLGQAILMLTIGVLKTLGLWLLGVPLALSLGVLAGILEFVPNIGPIVAGSIAALIALTQSPQQALYVVIFTLVLQAMESNILQPLVQQFAVHVPPVLTIVLQIVSATLFGFAGLLVATPLIAVSLRVVRMLYVEDVLGDREGGKG